jgi:D-3-phosphoglycerate dehydrogenase
MQALHVEPAAYGPEARRILERVANVDYVEVADRDALVAEIARAPYQVLVCRLGLAIDATVMAAAPSLRFVVTPTTGIDHIDVEHAAERNIRIISLRGEVEFLETIRSTAEHTFALLLALVRRIPEVHASVLQGSWERGDPARLDELAGKTLGILGVGRLGRMVAGYGLAFGMRVLGHDSDARQFDRAAPGIIPVLLDELIARSDVLSIHLPLTADTRGFLDAGRIARMPRGSILVNTARGELVDERALLAALESGHLAGAALDVLDGDSRWSGTSPRDHAVIEYARHHPNLLLSPHVGGFGRHSLARARQFIATKLADAISTEEKA